MSSTYGVKELFNTLLHLDQDLRVAQHAAIDIPEANRDKWMSCTRIMGEAQQKLQQALDALLVGTVAEKHLKEAETVRTLGLAREDTAESLHHVEVVETQGEAA